VLNAVQNRIPYPLVRSKYQEKEKTSASACKQLFEVLYPASFATEESQYNVANNFKILSYKEVDNRIE
jgi:hypothetical protein